MLSTAYVPAAEAAYIAGLSDRQLQRLFDENVLVDPFVVNQNGRFFTRISAAFAKFYFDLDDDLTASARRFVITQVCRRVLARSDADDLLALNFQPAIMDWDVGFKNFEIKLDAFVTQAQVRTAQIQDAHRLIVQDPDILGGQPVVKGTRLSVDTLVAMHRSGRSFAQLQLDYPSLTQELLDAAGVYQAIHPRRGRPVKSDALPVGWKVRSQKTVRAGNARV